MSSITRYWPFDVGQRERHTDQEKREVRFLETAYSKGYKPFEMGLGSYGALAPDGRGVEIIYRGRSGWEVAVHEPDQRVVNAFVDDFECAAQAMLEWLGGGLEMDVVSLVESHLVTMPGMLPGHELVVRPSQAVSNPRSH